MPADRIAWIDIETSGLNPARDTILEVACQVTDTDLNPLGSLYHAVIGDWPERIRAIRRGAHPTVQAMHDTSGLWDEHATSTLHTLDVEEGLLAHIKQHAPEPCQARIGGNSVHFDLGFLREQMPDVADHLHYRIVDVTSLATVADWWTGCGLRPKAKQHRAADDLAETLAEARWLRDHLKGRP